jgi:hypothetical protein
MRATQRFQLCNSSVPSSTSPLSLRHVGDGVKHHREQGDRPRGAPEKCNAKRLRRKRPLPSSSIALANRDRQRRHRGRAAPPSHLLPHDRELGSDGGAGETSVLRIAAGVGVDLQDGLGRRQWGRTAARSGANGGGAGAAKEDDGEEQGVPHARRQFTATTDFGTNPFNANLISVGYDGTVIQALPPEMQRHNDDGTLTCTWQWMPAAPVKRHP